MTIALVSHLSGNAMIIMTVRTEKMRSLLIQICLCKSAVGLTLKAPVMTAADDTFIIFTFIFRRK